jgi:hypothetical protein
MLTLNQPRISTPLLHLSSFFQFSLGQQKRSNRLLILQLNDLIGEKINLEIKMKKKLLFQSKMNCKRVRNT